MRSWKLFIILGLFTASALTWCVWLFMTPSEPSVDHVAELTTGIRLIHWINDDSGGEYSTTEAADIDAFVAALTTATKEVEPKPPGTTLALSDYHRLELTYLDGQRRKIVMIDLSDWLYQDLIRKEIVEFDGRSLRAFIRRMESAGEEAGDE